jgi:hypothetical protein
LKNMLSNSAKIAGTVRYPRSDCSRACPALVGLDLRSEPLLTTAYCCVLFAPESGIPDGNGIVLKTASGSLTEGNKGNEEKRLGLKRRFAEVHPEGLAP